MKSLSQFTIAPRTAAVDSIAAPGYTLHLRCDTPTSIAQFQYIPGGSQPDAKGFHDLDANAFGFNESLRGDSVLIVNFLMPQNWGKK